MLGYPNDFRRQNTVFSWTVTVPENRYVGITFTELALESPYENCNTFVAVLDGIGETAPELGRYCGFNIPDTIAATSNVITINFVVGSMPGKFFLEWNSINETDVIALRDRQVVSSSNTSFDIYINKTSSYVLTSPGYPTGIPGLRIEITKYIMTCDLFKGYGPRLNYNWTFHTLQSYHFKVNITDMNMEGYNFTCYYDMIKLIIPIRSDLSMWKVNKTVCGRYTGLIEMPAIHIMRINFITDYWGNRTGFNLTVSPICGGTLYGTYGYISTDDVMNEVKCTWKILVKLDRTIQLRFESLNIADNSNCQYSYILIRNGVRKSAPPLGGGRYCGQNIPTIPESATNGVIVEFFARRELHAVRMM